MLARELLKFSTPRDPALLARFVKLRVLEPENAFWRRGIEACVRYVKESGAGRLRVPYGFVTPDDWVPAGFPLGTWLADQRRFNKAGRLAADRVAELDGFGMVWSHRDVAFEEGLAAARGWAAVHGHFLPPATAVWDGYPVGTWAKNQRTAARLADTIAERRGAGLPVESSVKALTEARREALEEIDPGWCPAWDVGWQRCFRLAQAHVGDGGAVPTVVGEVIVQGEDLDARPAVALAGMTCCRSSSGCLRTFWSHAGRGRGTACETHTERQVGAQPPCCTAVPRPRRPPQRTRKHVEHLESEGGPAGRQGGTGGPVAIKLGMVLDNIRKRAGKLTAQRRTDLNQLGMRW
ncbi:helicase associated domain-containing protein [Streptomyces mobaraensis]|uniref:helicase associated domain-containing protein n=1 Tax=Streptomyces mobaraensis TaxID=35621 RepID=UPI0031013B0A